MFKLVFDYSIVEILMENQGDSPEGAQLNSERRAKLLIKARETSSSPGVYLMKDTEGVILYVGKAKNLTNRLSTYFQALPHDVARTEMLVNRIERFEVILTETESEALILECTFIKKHKPKFNVRLKDDKTYPYLKIRKDTPYPQIEWTRRVLRDGAHYFGPFPSALAARQVKVLLNDSFRLRDCSDNTFRNRSRPCILYQMHQCTAPCVGRISERDYGDVISEVVGVLEGKGERFIEGLHREMETAATEENYEYAADVRDQIRNLEVVTATQVVDEAGSHRMRDVVGLTRSGAEAHGVVLQIRGGKMLAVKHYTMLNADPSLSEGDLLREFLTQYYFISASSKGSKNSNNSLESQSGLPSVEDFPVGLEVLLSYLPVVEGTQLASTSLEDVLHFTMKVAENQHEEQLLNVARSNAQYALEQQMKKTQGHGVEALEEVQEKLHLPQLPARIECYDISNTSGEEPVASRVVFVDGAPDKNLYRRYKIKTVVGSNDFAMMKEVLGRRFSPENTEALPDLVVVDGGKGQLSQAVAIFEELNVQGVGVVGLAKARTEKDFQATEVKSSMERLFIPGRKNPLSLLPHTKAYRLLVHVRDEAHRFAISYHRLLRGKKSLQSGD